MGWVIVLEKDEVFYRALEEGLKAVDPQIAIKRFHDVREFLQWLQQLETRNPEALAAIPPAPLKGLITEIEGWGFRDINLIQKIKPLFVKLGYAQNEEELCIVLTGHDHPKLQISRYEHRFVNNFIFKPFDKLLLKQTLEFAFIGRQPVKNYHINNFQTNAQIEMLKAIRLKEVTEVGFETVSDQNVQINKIAKYYADFLETSQHKSAFARPVTCEPIGGTAFYKVQLTFFALDQQQSFNLQKLIKSQNKNRLLPDSESGNCEYVFIQHESSDLAQQLMPSFDRFFSCPSIGISSMSDFAEFAKERTESKRETKLFVFVDAAFWLGNEVGEVKAFKELFADQNMHLFLLSSRILPEPDERAIAEFCDDIFYAPFNRSYIIKNIKMRWPSLKRKGEELYVAHGEMNNMIYVSNPVQLKEVSEAGLVLQYYRELPVGTFREFIFWMPNEVDTPSLMGQCNYVEYDKEQKLYNCHFMFFGLKDYHLKHIRLWVLRNYIDNKSEE